jgi:hypothetical protein
MMRRTLSTQRNPRKALFRFKLAAAVAGVVTTSVVVLPAIVPNGALIPTVVAFALLLGSAALVTYRRSWRPLKQVDVDDRFVYVSNYGDTVDARPVAIPLSDVRRITQRRGRSFRPVTIHFRSPTVLGSSVMFQPRTDADEAGFAWSENQLVADLRMRAGLSR